MKKDPRAGLPGVVGDHRQSRRDWLRHSGMMYSFGDNFPKAGGYFWQMRGMVLVREQRPLRREATKTEPGDIRTLGENAFGTRRRQLPLIYAQRPKDAFFT